MSCSRRHFLRLSSATLLSAALFPRIARPGTLAAEVRELRELRRNVGIFTARGGTIGWLISPSGVVVVDSQYVETAPDALAAVRTRTALTLDALINTHHHGDHTGGNGVFRDATSRIVAHRRVPELQRATAGEERAAALTYADTLFDGEWTIQVGDETVRARHHGPAHTGGDCTVLFEQAGIVHLGDLVFNRAYPFIDRQGGASARGWIATLEQVLAEQPAETLYVFGHARAGMPVTGDRNDVLLQRDFLTAVLEQAQRAIAAGRSREEAAAVEQIPGFPDHGSISARLSAGAAVAAAYDELAAETTDPDRGS